MPGQRLPLRRCCASWRCCLRRKVTASFTNPPPATICATGGTVRTAPTTVGSRAGQLLGTCCVGGALHPERSLHLAARIAGLAPHPHPGRACPVAGGPGISSDGGRLVWPATTQPACGARSLMDAGPTVKAYAPGSGEAGLLCRCRGCCCVCRWAAQVSKDGCAARGRRCATACPPLLLRSPARHIPLFFTPPTLFLPPSVFPLPLQ